MKPQSVKIFFIIFPLYFKKLACFNQISKIHFLGPHFCWLRSPLGPHLIQNWVPIGSPFWTKLGPRGIWEQWVRDIECAWLIVQDMYEQKICFQLL